MNLLLYYSNTLKTILCKETNNMHIGNLNHLPLSSYLHPKLIDIINTVKERLHNAGFTEEKTDIEENVFVISAQAMTEPLADRQSEFHNNFIDVQILLEGQETFGYGYKGYDSISEDKLEQHDVAFIDTVVDEQYVTLQAGDYVVFYPHQPHRPLICVDKPEAIKKIVVKIHKSVLK